MFLKEGSSVRFGISTKYLRDRDAIRHFAHMLQVDVAKGKRFDCLITTNAELRRLNRRWRGKDSATDVLAFPVPPTTEKARFFIGDIAISGPRARAQANQFGHSPETEIYILMLHGLLHLTGLDHETDNGEMARAEDRFRKRLGLPRGLIVRGPESA